MLEITIDTREQTPFHFDDHIAKVRIGGLKTGDYACTGDRGFAVERKSLDDFLSTISSGWKRFQRGRSKYTAAQMVEIIRGIFRGDAQSRAIVPPQHAHFNLTPAFVLKRCGEIEHLGGHVQFCGLSAVAMCHTHLNERWKILTGEEE